MAQPAPHSTPGDSSAASRRLFFALPISEESRQTLTDLSARMQKAAHFMPINISWVQPVNYHITLHFLGTVPEPAARKLIAELPGAVADVPHFDLDLRHIGYFPNQRRPSVLWAGVHNPPPALSQVHANIAGLIQREGLELQHDNFHAHITLARFKGLKGTGMFVKQAQTYQFVHLGKSPTREVHLMESQFRPEGPAYSIISRGPLAGE